MRNYTDEIERLESQLKEIKVSLKEASKFTQEFLNKFGERLNNRSPLTPRRKIVLFDCSRMGIAGSGMLWKNSPTPTSSEEQYQSYFPNAREQSEGVFVPLSLGSSVSSRFVGRMHWRLNSGRGLQTLQDGKKLTANYAYHLRPARVSL